ncbi:MAG: prolipoprotein diacylglyceryl transferase [Deltaproteobacteria bacterium]|nr:MAG: prolipoprotein diacylglyceryl transferase [Deltaproteobacteria bacterium]RLB22022.1 MAG: prolipoprotein diacylglyceryl transferase [Deltaproteobacteria bacterium]
MIPYPHIDPDIITIGPIHIRWYGLMYVAGFVSGYFLIQRQQRSRQLGLKGPMAQELVFTLAIGLIVGARLGYLLFYQYPDFAYYLHHPIEILALWHGGMSFHGGLIGCVIAGWWFCRKRRLPFWAVGDSVIVTAPVGLGLGRIGNFINGELFGRVTDVPWAMVFPRGGPLPRHPSQLYEALTEGLILFILLWQLRKKQFSDGMMVVFFLVFYGLFRFVLEFFREPDPQLGFVLGPFTMGQVLCFFMIVGGVGLALALNRYQQATIRT